MTYPPHPYAELFPMIPNEDLGALTNDILRNGLIEPIVLLDELVLDGRNRQVACTNAGVQPRYVQFDGEDALAFVISKNLTRRHLNDDQRAAVASEIANMRQGERTDIEPSAILRKVSQPEAAAMMNVAQRRVEAANKVRREAPEVFERIKEGTLQTHVAVAIAGLPEEDRAAVLADENPKAAVKKVARAKKERQLAQAQTALPDSQYGVIYADPEWRFETYSQNGMDRSADNHYPTSTTEDIQARDVARIAADDCVLFLWATAPMLPQALSVMAAWGFEYKSQAVWVKDRIGTGYWFRNQHELLLIGTRGNIPAPAMGAQAASVIEAPVGRHSEKPPIVYELIESYFPNLPKIELNARQRREGWEAWGYESGGSQ